MGLEISDEEEIDTSALFNEIQEMLSTNKSIRAFVIKSDSCTCTKGKGLTKH